jgi:hypothetical protein
MTGTMENGGDESGNKVRSQIFLYGNDGFRNSIQIVTFQRPSRTVRTLWNGRRIAVGELWLVDLLMRIDRPLSLSLIEEID